MLTPCLPRASSAGPHCAPPRTRGADGHGPIMGDTEAFVTPWPDSGMRRFETFRVGEAAPGTGYRYRLPG